VLGLANTPSRWNTPDGWVTEILQFWFEEIAREAWFCKDEAFDQRLRERFLAHHEHVAALPISNCVCEARTAIAAVVALDQFPRNMFRGTPRAFASDAQALAIAERAIANGFEAQLSRDQRTFLYLPYEHAEGLQAQVRSVALMATLNDPELSQSALAHKEIVDRFGRFPHRNVILGRTSTPQEIAFLAQPGSAF
jgi:uncharacterized protein (DUF924 family)